ncbi:MAG: hypothetical protein PHH65_09685, partial [Eubacteriales bacterium]|nr:hypothetical protein [Eubacteriales bacterium]
DDASADASGDGFGNLAAMLAGIDPAFAARAVTASHGCHTFAWTALPGATGHLVNVTLGDVPVWSCMTNAFSVSVTGDFSAASHTLTVTSCGGVTSRTATATFRQPARPNLTVWKIADPFALEIPQGMTNIFEIAVPIARSDAWQQYFVSSGHDTAGAWALENMRLEWSDSGGGSGSAAASPPGDSLRPAVSADARTLTLRLVPDGPGPARSPKPLYLLAWSPAVTLEAPPETPSVPYGEGAALVAVSGRSGGDSGVSFSVDLSGRPHNAAPGRDERDGLSLPFGPGFPFSGTYSGDALTGGTVSAGPPGIFPLPSSPAANPPGGGAFQPGPPAPPPGAPPSALILISPLVIFEGGRYACCRHKGGYAYPFNSDCMSSARNDWDYDGCPVSDDGFSFTLGSEALDALFTLKTGGDPGSRHFWEDGENTRRVSAGLGGEEVWSASVGREPVIPCVWFSQSWPEDECGEPCSGCADGGCGGEDGDSSGSVRFRVSLGRDPRGRPYGFVWFVTQEPAGVTPALFAVSATPDVTVERGNGTGLLSRASCALPGGRDVRVEPVTGGVRVSARDTGSSSEDAAWTITSQTGSARFVRTDGSANLVSDATHTYNGQWGQTLWSRADSVSGSLTEILSWTYPEGGGFRQETACAGGAIASRVATETALIGSGPAAVEREILRAEWDGASASFRETRMSWREDSLNALRNGRPRLMERDGGAWEFRNHDSRGRDTLTATPLDGSAPPAAILYASADPETAQGLAALEGAACLAVTHSYAPVPGSGDTADCLDSRQPRETVAWTVRDGRAAPSSRVWRVYTRFETNGIPALAVRTVRAASAAAAFGDPANAVSLSISCAGAENADVPEELWNLPLREEREDGTLLTWA